MTPKLSHSVSIQEASCIALIHPSWAKLIQIISFGLYLSPFPIPSEIVLCFKK